MIASLPMYDWPELTTYHDDFWQALRLELAQTGLDLPSQLTRTSNDETHWLAPDLLLGQTCGYPFATSLHNKVTYVATPIYNVKGCTGPYYSSAIIINRHMQLNLKSSAGSRFAFNSTNSLSGYRAIKALIGEPKKYFGELIQSHGHRQSAKLVANGTADIAVIDAVCWHFIQQHDPAIAAELTVIGWTNKYPALPLITAHNTNKNTLSHLRLALQSLSSNPKTVQLLNNIAINGFQIINSKEYDSLSKL